jgi:hypothetical protein
LVKADAERRLTAAVSLSPIANATRFRVCVARLDCEVARLDCDEIAIGTVIFFREGALMATDDAMLETMPDIGRVQSFREEKRRKLGPITRLAAALTVGATTAALTTMAFGQADNTNSLTTPNWVPNHSYARNPAYDRPSSEPSYNYDPAFDSRRAYMDQAGRRWDATASSGRPSPAPFEPERVFGYPYADSSTPPSYARRGSTGVAQDSNPDDYATGIYNPKP